MIYVAGAPGNIGTELVRRLSAAGQPVRVLVHRPESAAALGFPGVETVVGDLDDPAALDRSVAGADAVFVNSSVPAILAQKNLIAAAQRAGVGRIVKLSWLDAAPDSPVGYGRAQAEVEQALRDSGVPFTIVAPSGFMQNLLGQAGSVAGQDAFYGSAGDGKAGWVDTRDIAAVGVAALTQPGLAGQRLAITGPTALAYGDMAAILSQVLGRPITYVNVTPDQMRESLKGYGLPESVAQDVVSTETLIREGKMSQVTDEVARVTGQSPISFETFARDHASAFQKA